MDDLYKKEADRGARIMFTTSEFHLAIDDVYEAAVDEDVQAASLKIDALIASLKSFKASMILGEL